MNRAQLEHVLRAAATIADERDIVVLGSQSILAALGRERLPPEVAASMEADVTFFDDPDDAKSDQVDDAIGELSPFHETHGYYAQGVSITTARLPQGWRERLVVMESPRPAPGRGHCLEPHDCVVSKLVAGQQKDLVFAEALLRAGLIDAGVLADRAEQVEHLPPIVLQRITGWLHRFLA